MFIFAIVHYTCNCVGMTTQPFDAPFPLQVPYFDNMTTSSRAKIPRTFITKADTIYGFLQNTKSKKNFKMLGILCTHNYTDKQCFYYLNPRPYCHLGPVRHRPETASLLKNTGIVTQNASMQ